MSKNAKDDPIPPSDQSPANTPRVEDFANLKQWHPLPPVQSELTSRVWEQRHIPGWVSNGRAWAGPKAELVVSCSGAAESLDEGPFATYGSCAYHWALRQEGKLFGDTITPNPKNTQSTRRRDQDRIKT